MSKQKREYRIRIRKEALDALGGRCAICGEDDWRVLQIDHINGGGSKERKSMKNTGTISAQIKIAKSPDKSSLQVLCANCNWRKRYENEEAGKRY